MKAYFLVLVASVILTIPWLGKEFYSRGEPREALVAQSMLTSGDWLVGTGYGGVVPSKPPFTHWLMCLSSYVSGGMNEFAARLPSGLALVIFAIVFSGFLYKRYGDEFSLVASLLLLLSAEWFRAGVSARVDTVLSVLLAGAFLSFYSASEAGFKRYPVLVPLLVCCATLTKGPVALLLSGAVFALYLLLVKESLPGIVRKLLLLLVPSALVAGLWYFAGFAAAGENFGAKFYYENIARFAGTMEDEPHRHSAFYLYGTIFIGLLPWTLMFMPVIARKVISWWRSRCSFEGFDRFQLFSLCIVVVFVVFYSIPTSKRSVYLLPAYPFLCFLLTKAVMDMGEFEKRWTSRATVLVACVSLVLLSVLLLSALDLISIPGLPDNMMILGPTFYVVGALMALTSLALIVKRFYHRSILGLRETLLLVYCLALLLNASVLPSFSMARSPKEFVAEIKNEVDKADRILSFGYEFYGVSFYLNRRIDRAQDSLRSGDLILLYESDLKEFNRKFGEQFSIKVIDRSSYEIEKPDGYVNLVSVIEKVL